MRNRGGGRGKIGGTKKKGRRKKKFEKKFSRRKGGGAGEKKIQGKETKVRGGMGGRTGETRNQFQGSWKLASSGSADYGTIRPYDQRGEKDIEKRKAARNGMTKLQRK